MTKEDKEDYKHLLQVLEERKTALLKLADKLKEYQLKFQENDIKDTKANEKKQS